MVGSEMNLSSPFIKRPVATTLMTIAIALAGWVAYLSLPVAPLPQIDFPTISISASLPGASPEIMAASVATPLERQLGHIAGITEMTSASSLGLTSVTLQFDLDRSIDGAARDVQAAINAARSYLPANLPANPTYRKVNPADSPIIILALQSKTHNQAYLYDVASTNIEQRLSQLQGVGQVAVGGSSLPAVRIEMNPTKVSDLGLTLAGITSKVSKQNSDIAKGHFHNDKESIQIVTNDQLRKAEGYRDLIVGYSNGSPVLLHDIATVQDSVQDMHNAGYLNSDPAILLIVYRIPGANILETVDRIRSALPGLEASMASGIKMTVVMDRTTTIRAGVIDVQRTLLLSILLVVLVVYIFLQSGRATFIPSVTVPVSLIGTFGIMKLMHYSIDNLSLMALTVSTGFVVDDAVVVIENISRHIENGKSVLEATYEGAKEIGFTILSISVSLVAVFIPILMMGGIVGRLLREFAMTLSISIAVSMVLSLTTTPMLCSLLLKDIDHHAKKGWFFTHVDAFFNWLIESYKRTLRTVLRHPYITLTSLMITIAANAFLIMSIPKGFFPQQDNGVIIGGIQGSQDISFLAMKDILKAYVEEVKRDPAVKEVMAFTGSRGSTNSGYVYIALKNLEERKIKADEIIGRLRPKLAKVTPKATLFLQADQDVRIGARSSNAQFQYTLQSENTQDLQNYGPLLLSKMRAIQGITDVNSDQQDKGLETRLNYDRATASRLGLNPVSIDTALYDNFGQSLASTIYTEMNQYYVVLEAAPAYTQSYNTLKDIYVPTPTGGRVPLNAIAKFERTNAALAVNHQGLFPSATVSFNLRPGYSLSEAEDKIAAIQEEKQWPPTLHGMFAGTMQAFQASMASEKILAVAAILAVYIVLGILYESLIHPITILSTLPSAGVGAVLILMFFHMQLDVVAFIGIILLIGIVKKNAILMIDFALSAERNEGKSPDDAIYEACILRFRPILMTTLAALFGAVPLAFGSGVGSELRRPLGISIIGGLIVSQVLTLYTTPVVYLCLDRLRARVTGKKHETVLQERAS
jgi:multidrug efflux pump